jgi:hypothetical protein
MIKKRTFLKNLSAGLAASLAAWSLEETHAGEIAPGAAVAKLKPGEIQHMVIFNLKHEQNAPEVAAFLKDGKRILSAIPGVRTFQVFSQVSKKNDYDFGFSMVFLGGAAYEKYNQHPAHVGFVEERWKKEVSRFLEIDFTARTL